MFGIGDLEELERAVTEVQVLERTLALSLIAQHTGLDLGPTGPDSEPLTTIDRSEQVGLLPEHLLGGQVPERAAVPERKEATQGRHTDSARIGRVVGNVFVSVLPDSLPLPLEIDPLCPLLDSSGEGRGVEPQREVESLHRIDLTAAP
jgi:hypothetical protein